MRDFLDFETKIAKLEGKIQELKSLAHGKDINITKEIITLQAKIQKLLQKTYLSLTPWQKVQVARHQDRPKFLDYLKIFRDFFELSGDRAFANDQSVICGLAKFNGRSVMVIGIQKGNTTETRIKHNFGMPRPEGYRKVKRVLNLANKFNLPVISFIDTAGAYPGVDGEARGQGEAIAASIQACFRVEAPFISIIIGEGCSGGAIAIGTADRLLMLEHSVFTVITPEGCSSILWKDATKANLAAEALKLTAQDLIKLGVIDEIIKEPVGGAHRFPSEAVRNVEDVINKHLNEFVGKKTQDIVQQRLKKYLNFHSKFAQ